MSQLNKSNWYSKFTNAVTGLFRTGQNRGIGSDDLRTFTEDTRDSVLFWLDHVIDEDSFTSNSAIKVPTQQSVKAYVDASVFAGGLSSFINMPATGITSSLQSIVTTSMSANAIALFRDSNNGNMLRAYILSSGTDATNSPYVIRPTDYATTTNEKVWKLINNVNQLSNPVVNAITSLKTIPTLNLNAGVYVMFEDLTENPVHVLLRVYRLVSGTTAESSPDVIRPNDYATTTNEKVWTLVNQNSADNKKITNVLDPVDPQDAATKAYVDSLIGDNAGYLASIPFSIADLRTIETVGLATGLYTIFRDTADGNILRSYVIEAGTDADNSPYVIRPDDYDGSTNQKVWKQVVVTNQLSKPEVSSISELKALVTTNMTVDTYCSFMDGTTNDILRTYRLTAGTTAESSPYVLRPDDYASSTNEKVWRLASGFGRYTEPGINTITTLKAIPTVSVAVGKVILFRDTDSSDALRAYELATGTLGESSPNIIRPDDYASSTNEKIWRLLKINTTADVTEFFDFVDDFPGTGTEGIIYVASYEYIPVELDNPNFDTTLTPWTNENYAGGGGGAPGTSWSHDGSENCAVVSLTTLNEVSKHLTQSLVATTGENFKVELTFECPSGSTTQIGLRWHDGATEHLSTSTSFNGTGADQVVELLDFDTNLDADSFSITVRRTNATAGDRFLKLVQMWQQVFTPSVYMWSDTEAAYFPVDRISLENGKLVTTKDIAIDDDTKGLILKSPDGHYWRVTVDNTGALDTTDLGTSL